MRLLISHNQMGTVIGRQGLKIKQIQDGSGVRMVAQKEMLPQSTERIVEVTGTPEAVQKAVWEIGKCLVDDEQRGYGTVLYNPVMRAQTVGAGPPLVNGGAPPQQSYGTPRSSYNRTGSGADFADIGRAGSKISEIRRNSGARISIAKAPHDETGERMFTITGSQVSNEKALYLLYENLEAEKMRRSQAPADA